MYISGDTNPDDVVASAEHRDGIHSTPPIIDSELQGAGDEEVIFTHLHERRTPYKGWDHDRRMACAFDRASCAVAVEDPKPRAGK